MSEPNEPQVGSEPTSIPVAPPYTPAAGLVRYIDALGLERNAIVANLSTDGKHADLYVFGEPNTQGIYPALDTPYAELVGGEVERVSWHY